MANDHSTTHFTIPQLFTNSQPNSQPTSQIKRTKKKRKIITGIIYELKKSIYCLSSIIQNMTHSHSHPHPPSDSDSYRVHFSSMSVFFLTRNHCSSSTAPLQTLIQKNLKKEFFRGRRRRPTNSPISFSLFFFFLSLSHK
jgi:hypothetical protein